jgi:hypothetical protein
MFMILLPHPTPTKLALTQPRPSGEAVPANRRSHRPTRRASLRCANVRHLPVSFVHADLTPSPPTADTLNPRSCDCAEPPNARATMRSLPLVVLPSLLACANVAIASDMIAPNRIKVQLFAAPAFFSEVSVDAYDGQCLSLDNNL